LNVNDVVVESSLLLSLPSSSMLTWRGPWPCVSSCDSQRVPSWSFSHLLITIWRYQDVVITKNQEGLHENCTNQSVPLSVSLNSQLDTEKLDVCAQRWLFALAIRRWLRLVLTADSGFATIMCVWTIYCTSLFGLNRAWIYFFEFHYRGEDWWWEKKMWDQGSLVAWVVVQEFVPWSDDACVCEWDILHHHHQDTVETWLVCYRNLVSIYFGPYSQCISTWNHLLLSTISLPLHE